VVITKYRGKKMALVKPQSAKPEITPTFLGWWYVNTAKKRAVLLKPLGRPLISSDFQNPDIQVFSIKLKCNCAVDHSLSESDSDDDDENDEHLYVSAKKEIDYSSKEHENHMVTSREILVGNLCEQKQWKTLDNGEIRFSKNFSHPERSPTFIQQYFAYLTSNNHWYVFLVPCSKKETKTIRNFYGGGGNRSWYDTFLNEKTSIIVPSLKMCTEVLIRFAKKLIHKENEYQTLTLLLFQRNTNKYFWMSGESINQPKNYFKPLSKRLHKKHLEPYQASSLAILVVPFNNVSLKTQLTKFYVEDWKIEKNSEVFLTHGKHDHLVYDEMNNIYYDIEHSVWFVILKKVKYHSDILWIRLCNQNGVTSPKWEDTLRTSLRSACEDLVKRYPDKKDIFEGNVLEKAFNGLPPHVYSSSDDANYDEDYVSETDESDIDKKDKLERCAIELPKTTKTKQTQDITQSPNKKIKI
jgi:hypothetical protein